MQIVLDLAPGAPIHGRMRSAAGPWLEFTGWSQLVAEVERAQREAGEVPRDGAAQGIRGDAGADA